MDGGCSVANKNTRRVSKSERRTQTLPIDEHVQQQREKLLQEREEAPQLRRMAEELRLRAASMSFRWQTRARLDLERQAAECESEAAERESMRREHKFERMVVGYVRMFRKWSHIHQRPSSSSSSPVQLVDGSTSSEAFFHRQVDQNTQMQTNIVEEYMREVGKPPAKVAMAQSDDCPRCRTAGTTLLLRPAKSILTCPTCGYSKLYLDSTNSSTAFDESVEFSQYSYKRINHYAMWIQLVQGKETHRVPDAVLRAVMADLHDRQGVRSVEEITQRLVRDTLRKLRLRKAYDHVAQITSRLTGRKPPRITNKEKEKLKCLFLQMQPAFHRHAPKSRTNFLSYSYVLYRSFQILGMNHMLDGINLLKGRDKLEANDAIFRKMSVDLGWPLFDLPPVGREG